METCNLQLLPPGHSSNTPVVLSTTKNGPDPTTGPVGIWSCHPSPPVTTRVLSLPFEPEVIYTPFLVLIIPVGPV